MSRPWMPLYVADYLADTRRLSTLEHGAYLLLIMEYWLHGGLPTEDEDLADISGLEIEQWMAIRPRISKLFKDGWSHKRIDEELAKSAEISNRRRESADRRWSKCNANAVHDDSKIKQEQVTCNARAGVLQSQSQSQSLDPEGSLPSEIENSTKPLPVQNERAPEKPFRKNNYTIDFDEFWKVYPTDPNMSKKEAFAVWRKLSQEAKKAAVDSVPGFVAYCKGHPDYRPVHACRYLSKDRAAGHLAAAEKVRSAENSVYVKRDTPQWSAWSDWYFRTKGQGPPTDTKGGWYFPSPWPPAGKTVAPIENRPLPQLTN